MVAERNALQSRVFPRLRELAARHGWRFQPIDLRWGVSEEASLDQRAMPICLEELRRCQELSPRPNFLVLLGDRYGWRPLPHRISAETFNDFLCLATGEEEERLDHWYRLDRNAVPASYVLQPRQGESADFAVWEKVERRMRSFFVSALDRINLPEEEKLSFLASATAQEIHAGALQVEDAHEHVVCCVREIAGLSPTPEAADYVDLLPGGQPDSAARKALSKLVECLDAKLEGNLLRHQANWHGAGHDGSHLDAFCADVHARLEALFLEQIAADEQIQPLQQEIEAHETFQQQRNSTFIGREDALRLISDYLNQQSPSAPLAIIGAGGSGKSALLARAIQKAREQHPQAQLIQRFIGATPQSGDIRSLLSSLHRQISQSYELHGDPPGEFKELVESFHALLANATEERPLVLFLDALDQLSTAESAQLLTWLPADLPEHVHLVTSVLEGPVAERLRSRLPDELVHLLAPMDKEAGEQLLTEWLRQAGRTLQPQQHQSVMGAFSTCGLPLYLRLAFEEARRWTSWQEAETFAPDIDGILDKLFERLKEEHGQLLTERSLGYLAAAKNGLTEDEMLDLLSCDEELFQDFLKSIHHELPEQKLPIILWSRLYADLAPYLTERQADGTNLMTFYHRQIGGAVRRVFLSEEVKADRHRHLASYFAAQPLLHEPKQITSANARKTAELPYQYANGNQAEELEAILTDFEFGMAKCAAGQLDGWLEDYELATNTIGLPSRDYRIWASFLRSQAHILRRGNAKWPTYKILLQLAIEHADDSPLSIKAETFLAEGMCGWGWLRRQRRVKSADFDPCLAVFEGHTGAVEGALVLPDGRVLSWSEDKSLRLWKDGSELAVMEGHTEIVSGAQVLSNGRILSWSEDHTLRLWSGEGMLLRELVGHEGAVIGTHVLAAERFLSWSNDNSLRFWSGGGEPHAVLKGHTETIRGVHVLVDGRILSWSDDKTLRLWTGEGIQLAVLEGHDGEVSGAQVLADGGFLSWSSDDGTLRRWSDKGELLAVWEHLAIDRSGQWMEGLLAGVRGAEILVDGRILTWANDGTLRFWSEEREPLAILEGHTCVVGGAEVLDDGRVLSWGDKTIRLWSSEGEPLAVLAAHEYAVSGIHVLADGRFLSRSYDTSLRLWSAAGEPLTVLKGHTESISGVHVLPDGSFLSWSRDNTLILWSGERAPLTMLVGHESKVRGILGLADGRALSWSSDNSLILWSGKGELLATLEGHTRKINGADDFADGRILSWSDDKTLRLWSRTGEPLMVLEGHDGEVEGAHVLTDGRILSWSVYDGTLRLWSPEGESLAVLDGHEGWISGAHVLTDGRFLSWSKDRTLRLWSTQGEPLAVMESVNSVTGAHVLADGRFLSWSDNILQFWSEDGKRLEMLEGPPVKILDVHTLADGRFLSWSEGATLLLWSEDNHPRQICSYDELYDLDPLIWTYSFPEHTPLFPEVCLEGGWVLLVGSHQVLLNGEGIQLFWHAKSKSKPEGLFFDGRAVVTQDNGQVCFLTTWHGNKRVSLEELEQLEAVQ